MENTLFSTRISALVLALTLAACAATPDDERQSVSIAGFGSGFVAGYLAESDIPSSLAQVRIPVLALAGSADRLIAPWRGCEALARAFGGPDVEFLLCSKAAGFAEDYSHSRLLMSGNAQSDVFPWIAQWIRLRSALAQ